MSEYSEGPPTPEMLVEHLDGQVNTLLRENEDLRGAIDDHCAEIERLRAALEKIASVKPESWTTNVARNTLNDGTVPPPQKAQD